MKNLTIYLFLIFNTCNARDPGPVTQKQSAQSFKKLDPKDYPQNYFRNPLGIPIQLSANFGELRANHFHMGWDIRTNQRENLPVYAAAEGYVSKISIAETGFGHAIYITHPNGFTTVYGHLNDFYPALAKFLKDKQYADESWQQDISFTPEQFPVTKGQFIAFSGNTGSSAGPHLHFEIRENVTGNNVNPWLFNFRLADNLRPFIYRLYYYDRRYSTYTTSPKAIAIKGSNGIYSTNGVVVLNSPYISFGISAEDKVNASPFTFGIYGAELLIDDSLKSSFLLNDISYNNTRYLNASIDYKTRFSGGAYIQHLSLLPGNRSTIFSSEAPNDVIDIADTGVHQAEIIVTDVTGNRAVLAFKFRVNDGAPTGPASAADNTISLLPNTENLFEQDDIKVTFPATAFYDTVPFIYKSEVPKDPKTVSLIHYLHNFKVPVHDSFTVNIQPSVTLTDEQKDRIIMHLESNKKTEAVKGSWINNAMSAKFRDLGIVRLIYDTIPPVVIPSGWKNGSRLSASKSLSIIARDNVGKIKTFNVYVDGKWMLFSRKGGMFTHKFDERTLPGSHELRVLAEDVAGNVTERSYTFTR
jgi:hypothetical protein